MKIPISEIFESIQGEGRNTGKPSIFVRFWGCNLTCTWCDSKYSWDPSVETADIMEFDEVIKIIRNFNAKHIIFTGGEPTLYQKHMRLIQEELGSEYTLELETNGSKEIIEQLEFEQINVSPKLNSSGNKDYELEILKSNISNMMTEYLDLKYVCSNLIDTKETDKSIQDISEKYGLEVFDDIYIMPLGRDKKSQVNDFLVKYCIKNNYKYCLRQHLIMFGDGKGK